MTATSPTGSSSLDTLSTSPGMTRRIHLSPPFRSVTIAVAVLVLSGGFWFVRTGNAEAAKPLVSAAAGTNAPASIELSEAQWSTLDVKEAMPVAFPILAIADAVVSVDERLTVPVFSPATGRVTAVTVDNGQGVHRGQMLASIAGTETAQAVSDLSAASAQAATAAQQLTLSREVAARQLGLVDAGGGAAKDWRQSQSDLIAAEGAKRIADAALVAAQIKATSVGADASSPDDPSNLARLTAPIDGQVIQRQVAAGQFISSLAAGGAVPLFTISDLHHVWVVGSLSERDGATLRVGQPVEISTLVRPSSPLKSVVSWVGPTVDPLTRRIQFRVEIANPDLALKPQMTARIRVMDAGAARTIAIPSVAVIRDGDEAHCYVVSGVRTLTLRPLVLGRSEAGMTEVLSGLKQGERVVARGAIFVDTLAEGAAS